MTVMDRIREMLGRAKESAADMAQVANIKLDIRGLEGRRDHLFREIGRKVYAMRGETHAVAEFEPSCAEIAQLEERIRDKEKELQAVRDRSPSGSGRERAPTP